MKRTLLNLVLLTFLSTYIFAESGGTVTGIISDKTTRQPIIGANIFIASLSKGTTSDENGSFSLLDIEPGTYTIRFSYLGYKTISQTDVVVNNVSFTKLNIQLEPADVELGTVEVVAGYFRRNTDAITSIQSFSYEEIRRQPGGFEDAIRAVSVVPGVGTQANGRNDLIVRGGGPSENLFLIDGLEIQNISHFGTQGATGGPLTLVNVDFIEGTDFSTGGFGVRYGDKLSSVMNIKLREGRSDRWGGKGTISATQFGLNLEGPTSKSSTFMGSIRRSYLDWIFKAAGFGFIPEYWDFQGKYINQFNTENRLEIFAIGALDNVILNNDTREKRVSNSRILGSDQNQYMVGATWQHVLPSGLMNVTLGRTYVDFDTKQTDSSLTTIFNNTSKEIENSLRVEMIKEINRFTEITVGGQIKHINATTNLNIPPFTSSFGDTLSVSNFRNEINAFKSAIFFQFSQRILPFDYTVGLRADYFSALTNGWSFSPRLSAGYTITDFHRLTIATGIYHQTPSYIWIANNSNNKNLKQFQAFQVVAGHEWLLRSDTQLKTEIYTKSYRNYPASVSRPYVILANTGSGFNSSGFESFGFDQLVSEGSGIAKGIEFQLQKKLSDSPFYGTISLSINEVEFTPLNGKTYPGSYSQPILFNLAGGYQLTKEWELSLKFRAASGLPYTPFNSDGTQDVANYNSKRFDVIHQLDIRVDRRWNFVNWNLITYVDIQNIYARQNQFDIQWDKEKNEVLKQQGIGLLPSIGVTAEF